MSERLVYPHPLVDSREDGVVISQTSAQRVALDAARADFLVSAQQRGRRPILVTHAGAVLTEPLVRVLREAGGAWGVQSPEGAWDGLTGRRLTRASAARREPVREPDELHPLSLAADAAPHAVRIRLFTSRRHRDALETVLGGDIETVALALTGSLPAGWGVHEPSGMAWDRDQITLHAREVGTPARYLVVGHSDTHPLSAQLSVHRTHKGVEELCEILITIGEAADPATAQRLALLPAILERLSDGVPLFAMAFADPGRTDLFRAPRLARPTWPLAMLIGAPGTRILGVDPGEFAERHNGRVVGRHRVPAILLNLTDADPASAWGRMRTIVDEIGEDRLMKASPALSGLLFGGGAR